MKDKRRLSDHEVPRLAVEVGAMPPRCAEGLCPSGWHQGIRGYAPKFRGTARSKYIS